MENESLSSRILKSLALLFMTAVCLAGTLYLILNAYTLIYFLNDTGFSFSCDKTVILTLQVKYLEAQNTIKKIERNGLTEKEIAAIRNSGEYITASAGTKHFREAFLKNIEYKKKYQYQK